MHTALDASQQLCDIEGHLLTDDAPLRYNEVVLGREARHRHQSDVVQVRAMCREHFVVRRRSDRWAAAGFQDEQIPRIAVRKHLGYLRPPGLARPNLQRSW